jgi:DNA-binding HxlR family transcriptional regulator
VSTLVSSQPLTAAVQLARLCHHRWALPVLAALHAGYGGGRVAPLLHRLGVARPSLRRTLDDLTALGLVRWNPGYGHPLRPELLLLGPGRKLAPGCAALLAAADEEGARDVVLCKWSLGALAALASGRERFSLLAGALGSVTPRALVLALRGLEGAQLVERAVYDDVPARVLYRLTPAGRRLARLALALAG